MSLEKIYADIAQKYGTPCYVYTQSVIEKNFLYFQKIFQHVHYAVKANSNIALLHILAKLGSGFDIVSGGELARVLKAGANAAQIVFSGAGKQDWEIENALKVKIACFNVESLFELHQIQKIARYLNKIAPVAFRINPNISVLTHPYIATGLKENKFGISHDLAVEAYQTAQNLPHIALTGIACHLGSQIFSPVPYLAALQKLLDLKLKLKNTLNINLGHVDIGGGFGVYDHHKKSVSKKSHESQNPKKSEKLKISQNFNIAELALEIQQLLARYDLTADIWIEPGRAVIAQAGVLLARVISIKSQGGKNFAVVDAAMNDLMRPALYEAYHEIVKIRFNSHPGSHSDNQKLVYDIVGPVCETGDFLGKNRTLCLAPNDLLAVKQAGAYGFSMSSNYNSRPRAAEVLIDRDFIPRLIRRRETLEDLTAQEIGLN